MFENEAFASHSRHEGVAISALIAGIEEDSKSDVSLPITKTIRCKFTNNEDNQM